MHRGGFGGGGMRLVLALIAVGLGSAPARPVVSYDAATDFSPYHSYSFVFSHQPANMDPTLYRRVRAAIDHSLAARGFVRSNPGDFAVGFTLGSRAKMHAWDYGHYAFYYSAEESAAHQNWVNRELSVRSDRDDTLSIDLYDTNTKHSIWHGIAPIPIAPNTRHAIIDHEVDDVLSLFPPKQQ
jgi:hypothetical protein